MLLAAALLLPLGLDTFALAAVLGVAGLGPPDRTRVAFVFTAFEAGMPLLGILVGRAIGACWAGPPTTSESLCYSPPRSTCCARAGRTTK